ncbi:hypothetical protein [Bacteroides heparinolyticus]|uniref:hypothetical protein n=1 Tax=Prevotella heparinolytica TaxID=28113 RepID=UPI00359FB07A
MRYLLLILFFTFMLSSCGTKQTSRRDKPYILKVKMKETDCFRCVSGQITMLDLSKVADVEIIFNGLNDNSINRFLETNELEYTKTAEGFRIVSDKEEYAKLNTIPSVSEGHLYDRKGNEILVYQFRLDKATMSRLNLIQRKGHALMQQELVSLETEFDNDGIDFSIQKGFFVLTNGPMNLCQIFNSAGELVREINGNLVDPSDVFPELKELDTQRLKSIKDNGHYKSSIEEAFIIGNEIWIGYNVSCPVLEGRNVILYSYYQLLSYPIYDSTQDFNVIFDGKMHDAIALVPWLSHEGDTYAIIERYDGDVLFTHTQAKCQLQDGMLIMENEHPVKYPDFAHQKLVWYRPVLKDGLLNFGLTEYLVDIQNDTVLNLPFRYNIRIEDNGGFDIKISQDAQMTDFAFDGETLGVVYFDIVEGKQGKCHHLSWRNGQKTFSDNEIMLPKGEIIGVKLSMPDVVHYLTKDNKVGTIVMESQ